MTWIERQDEDHRFMGLRYIPDGKDIYLVTHTYSYLYCRRQFQSMGETMGLEKTIEENENDSRR